MKVKLKAGCYVNFFTDGKEYEVLNADEYYYFLADDDGDEDWVDQDYFEIVEEDKQLPLVMKFKVDSLLDSLLIQKALFEAGYSWAESGDKVREKYYPYIYANHDKNIWTSDNANLYKDHFRSSFHSRINIEDCRTC